MSIFLYACESWTLTADTERRIQAMEMRCLRKLLGITYRDHISNEEVRNRTRQAIGPHEDLLTTVKRRKLKWYGHVTRSSGLAKTILQGTVQGGRRRGRQKKRWEDNIPEWTGMTLGAAMRKAERREEWRELVARSSVTPQRERDKTRTGHTMRSYLIPAAAAVTSDARVFVALLSLWRCRVSMRVERRSWRRRRMCERVKLPPKGLARSSVTMTSCGIPDERWRWRRWITATCFGDAAFRCDLNGDRDGTDRFGSSLIVTTRGILVAKLENSNSFHDCAHLKSQ
ncbi:hypothetical protein NP493_774g00016 [Ridgeia piscesae]|uniref:Endonuclease-reverse transcriptase n=1 Tax=Ridgeia piscesae TaxID=27915 RepID=A0AAD9KQ78_RIDPI|nr:hypothetical protein NP493_774g00016 [Ridgeia piscesae]